MAAPLCSFGRAGAFFVSAFSESHFQVNRTMPSIQTILHPTDFSESSRHAFETACSLVKDGSTRLIVLHVAPPFTGPIPVEPAPNPLVSAESQDFLRGRYTWP